MTPYPYDEAPSQRFRFEQYYDLLKKSGFEINLAPFWDKSAWKILYKKGSSARKAIHLILGFLRRLRILIQALKYDVVFLHREASPLGPPVFEFIIAKILRKRVIYDFDDAIWLPNTSDQNKLASRLKFHDKVASICRWSEKVSCGNSFLAEYANQYNNAVVINPTTIDTDYHIAKKSSSEKKPLTIGWTGTHSTVKYLDEILPVLIRIKDEYNIEIVIISNQRPSWTFNDYRFIPWSKDREIEDLSKIDIGIMPLDNTIWEEGKCGFKALQYMALGIPAIASNVGVNKEIINHGVNGFLCESHDDWYESLKLLIAREEKRLEIGIEARKRVEDYYSVKSNSDLFLSLFA